MDSVRILHVEDDPNDRELTRLALEREGLTCEVDYVDERSAFEAALLRDTFDVILADYNLPRFDGLTAHAIAKRLAPMTPFIFVSGTLGEELAVDRLKDGATDYVLKQRLDRLPTAVRRARAEAQERIERQRAEQQVRQLHAELEARAARSDALIQAIVEHSPMGISVRDRDGRLLLISPSAKAIDDAAPPRMADIYRANDRLVFDTRQPRTFEEPFVRPSGDLGVLEAHRFALVDASGRVYAVVCLAEDVTDRKRQDDELRLARLEAERANLAKSTFLSRMSHDLRTPLNAILGFAQLLESEPLPADGVESIKQILSGGRHLLDLINEVLDITRIETGHLSLSTEPVSVREIVDRTVGLVRPLAAQRGIAIDIASDVTESATVLADRQRLGQILINLLSNAVKYNRPNGRVTVRFDAADDHRPLSRIVVADTGAGIRPEKLKLLFQPFERLGAEHTTTEGTGLGLSLSRGLARALGGELGVNSVVDKGSEFWVALPPAVMPAPRHAAQAATDVADASPCAGIVLYVEDNTANVRLMERILQRRPGVRLIHAAHGLEVPSLIAAHHPNLILLDLHLPDISGDELLRRLWADRRTRAIPKVMVTADATPGLVKRLTAAGAAECLTKPIDVAELLDVVDRVLGAVHE